MTQPPVGDDGFGPTRFERSATTQQRGGSTAAGPGGFDPARRSQVAGSTAGVATAPAPPTTVNPPVPPAGSPNPGVGPAPAAAKPSRPGKASARNRGPRRARLQLRNINVWTVFRFSCVLAVFLFVAWIIVVMLLFGVLDAAGAIGSINDSVQTINGSSAITGGKVFVYGLIIGAVNAILFIALATVGSLVYNLCSDLVGGVEVTLSERDA